MSAGGKWNAAAESVLTTSQLQSTIQILEHKDTILRCARELI